MHLQAVAGNAQALNQTQTLGRRTHAPHTHLPQLIRQPSSPVHDPVPYLNRNQRQRLPLPKQSMLHPWLPAAALL